MIPNVVSLSWGEIRIAALVGIDRYLRAIARARTPNLRTTVNNWEAHIVGALGECAVATALDLHWNAGSPDLDHDGDLARLQIRATTRSSGGLIVRPRDDDLSVFVLVIEDPPRFYLPGWITGAEAKSERYYRDPDSSIGDPYFLVPQSALRPLDYLSDDPALDRTENDP